MPRTGELKLPTSSPKRQVSSKLRWNESRSADEADFYTLGYSGRTFDVILDSLILHNVSTLLDVRTNAVSMYRPEFSKSNLKSSLGEKGIAYLHLPDLGVPRDVRAKAIQAGSRDVIWAWYDEHVASALIGNNLHHFFNAFEHPVALMCSELDPHECHRHRLGLLLERLGLRGYDL